MFGVFRARMMVISFLPCQNLISRKLIIIIILNPVILRKESISLIQISRSLYSQAQNYKKGLIALFFLFNEVTVAPSCAPLPPARRSLRTLQHWKTPQFWSNWRKPPEGDLTNGVGCRIIVVIHGGAFGFDVGYETDGACQGGIPCKIIPKTINAHDERFALAA